MSLFDCKSLEWVVYSLNWRSCLDILQVAIEEHGPFIVGRGSLHLYRAAVHRLRIFAIVSYVLLLYCVCLLAFLFLLLRCSPQTLQMQKYEPRETSRLLIGVVLQVTLSSTLALTLLQRADCFAVSVTA